MSWRKLRRNLGFLATIAVIAVLGTIAAADVLMHERLPDPFVNTYNVYVQLSAADGVVPGYGQPVNVAGVPIGVIAGARVSDGDALIKMAIQRGKLPHVYRDATASLEPVTPLKDMELDLDPGHPAAGTLAPGGEIPLARTTSPAELEDLLGALDGDTRSFLSSLITSLGTGTAGQGANFRKFLVDLGPTATQIRQITSALASRRQQIAELVHNLSLVTGAASQDGQLARVVQSGDATLHAVAGQDAALRQSIAKFPAALSATSRALSDAKTISDALGPSLTALTPAVRQLPATLHALGPFSRQTATALQSEIRPFVRAAEPTLRALAPAVPKLTAITPQLTGAFKVLNYTVNELAYNPGGNDPGMLFWLDWAAHNVDSATGNEDSQGSIARTLVLASCQQLTSSEGIGALLSKLLGVSDVCKGTG